MLTRSAKTVGVDTQPARPGNLALYRHLGYTETGRGVEGGCHRVQLVTVLTSRRRSGEPRAV